MLVMHSIVLIGSGVKRVGMVLVSLIVRIRLVLLLLVEARKVVRKEVFFLVVLLLRGVVV